MNVAPPLPRAPSSPCTLVGLNAVGDNGKVVLIGSHRSVSLQATPAGFSPSGEGRSSIEPLMSNAWRKGTKALELNIEEGIVWQG